MLLRKRLCWKQQENFAGEWYLLNTMSNAGILRFNTYRKHIMSNTNVNILKKTYTASLIPWETWEKPSLYPMTKVTITKGRRKSRERGPEGAEIVNCDLYWPSLLKERRRALCASSGEKEESCRSVFGATRLPSSACRGHHCLHHVNTPGLPTWRSLVTYTSLIHTKKDSYTNFFA